MDNIESKNQKQSDRFSIYRYERHIDLPHFGMEGQQKLTDAKVCIIGAGGLGCPVSLYLAAAGIGEMTLVDDDEVSITNLQRQILYGTEDEGEKKTSVAQRKLSSINPKLRIKAVADKLTKENCKSILKGHTIIVDCSDNYDTRYLINQVTRRLNITLISGAVVHYAGQVFVFKESSACYACLFPTQPDQVTAPVCTQAGVLGPVVGVIGTLMSVEVIKEICSLGESLAGTFLAYNALKSDIQRVSFSKKEECPVCRLRGQQGTK